MRGTLYSRETKRLVSKLRSQGKSYQEIRKVLGVPKSTLSTWLSKKYPHLYNREKQLRHLAKARPLAIAAIKRRVDNENQLIRGRITSEIKKYPLSDAGLQKAILAALYWAEGSKTGNGMKFANTDPNLHQLFVNLLRKCFKPDESKFRVHLYVHHYHRINECKKFWSRLLNIPQRQFWKVYIKKRSVTKRFRRNFRGICFLYHSDSKLRKEMMELAHQLHIHYK